MSQIEPNNTRSNLDMPSRRESDILLARIDERSQSMQRELHKLNEEFTNYVTKQEFVPVRLLVYGLTGILLTSVLMVILAKTLGAAG